ncbi:MAG: hypothetical protein WDW38_002484 [Sanguina aurantia]
MGRSSCYDVSSTTPWTLIYLFRDPTDTPTDDPPDRAAAAHHLNLAPTQLGKLTTVTGEDTLPRIRTRTAAALPASSLQLHRV